MPPEAESPEVVASSPERRAPLERNLLFLYGGEGAAKVLALLSFGWISRHVQKDAYGDLEFAVAVFFVLNLVMEAGLDPFGAREGAKRPESLGRLAGAIVYLRLLLLGASLLALGAAAAGIGLDTRAGRLVLLYGLVLTPGPFVLNWAFQARDRMHVVAGSTFLRQLVFYGGALALVATPADVVWVPAIDAAGLAAVALAQNLLFRRDGTRIGGRPRGADLAHVWRDGSALAGSTLAWALRVFAPTLILWLATDASDTARYGSAHRLVVALHAFVWLYFMNLLPSISRAALDRGGEAYRRLIGRSLLLVGWTVLPGILALCLLAPALLPLVFGAEFEDAARPFQIAIWMPFVAFLSGHHRYGLIAQGHVRAEFTASLAGALTAIALSLGLAAAGRLSAETAAAAFVAGELATLVVARAAITSLVERTPLTPRLARPAAAAGLGLALALLLAPGSAWLGCGLVLGTTALLAPLLQRDLVAQLRDLLAAVRR